MRYPLATVELVVEERLDLRSEAARELFALPDDGTRSRTLPPGTPTELLGGYWLGPRFGELEAVVAIERDAPRDDGYFVFYGEGPKSPEALQIASGRPDDGALGLEGGNAHAVTLANGERARLVAVSPADGSYVVETATTLVGFVAGSPDEAERIAAALQPVAP